jgi:hypothetical protein
VPEPETLQRGFWLLSHGRAQRAYFRLWLARTLVTFALLAAPALPAAVPLDVDRAWTRLFPRTCFRCGAAGHLTRECPVPSDVRHTDVLDEVVRQLRDDLLDELFARLSTSASLPAESVDGDEMEPAGFPRPAE